MRTIMSTVALLATIMFAGTVLADGPVHFRKTNMHAAGYLKVGTGCTGQGTGDLCVGDDLTVIGTTDFTGAVTLDGPLSIGAGTPGITPGANDAYVTGTLEADGTAKLDGDVTLGDAVTDGLTLTGAIQGATGLIFDGATDDTNYINFLITDPGGVFDITVPAETGSMLTSASTKTNSVPLPIGSWLSETVPLPLDASAADAEPDFATINNGAVITYDITGGSVDTVHITNAFVVPEDYSADGSFVFLASQDGATAGDIETITCDVSINGAALTGAVSANLVDQTAIQTLAVVVGSYAAGDSVAVICKQGNATADDTASFHAIKFAYTSLY